MTKISWFKKIWNGRSKGVSTVIGTVFLILIIFMVSTNVLLWTFSQNAQYTQAVKGENQNFADTVNENIVALGGNYSVLGDEVTVEVILKNVGSVAAQIINLWVFDADANQTTQGYSNKSLSFYLPPGDTLNFIGLSGLTVTIVGADPSDDFISWFVTARGNTIPLEQIEEVVLAQLAQGIGYLAMDFESFRYFTYNGSQLDLYPTGATDYNVPHKTDIAFGLSLTNLDPEKRAILLDPHSQMWLYFPAVPGAGPFVWYIVNVINGTITTPYSEISIGYRETALLIFASAQAGGFVKESLTHPNVANKLCAVNLCLYGKIGLEDYGQNIPFVSLYCS